MPCPHSNSPGSSPQLCSLCLQATTAFDVRRYTVDSAGVVRVNGEALKPLAELNKEKYQQETAAVGPPQRQKRCGRCQQFGHNVRSCNNEIVN